MNTPTRVMKFGGSSVGAPDRLAQAVSIVARECAAGPVAVVVSAMGDTTDHLIEAMDLAARGDDAAAEAVVDRVADLATANGLVVLQAIERELPQGVARAQITPMVRELLGPLRKLLYGVSLLRERTAQTLDLVMSFGERLSASVVAALLAARGVPAAFVDARDWLVTDARFGDALVDWEATRLRVEALREAWAAVTVHTGFIGRTPDGRTTTLGRNGSDYTATLLARALGASEVDIWTDVSGVMTADPALVADAYPLARMSYMEALELASFGARMFHPRTMIPLMESGIPMRIRSTMHPGAPGTRIDGAPSGDARPTCVTSLENLALVDLRWRRLSGAGHLGERALKSLDAAGVTVWMASQAAHGQAVAVVIPRAQIARAKEALARELATEFERGDLGAVGVREPVTLLSLVEENMAQAPSAPGRFFAALGGVGVSVRAIAQGASSRSISCAVDAEDTALAVRTVHAAFNFAHQEVNLLVLGKGVVGSNLLDQIEQQGEYLRRAHGVSLKVVGVASSRATVFDPRGLALDGWRQRYFSGPGDGEPTDLGDLLARMERLPVPVLVDCTALDGMEARYEKALSRGVHVVSANKKPLAVPWPARERLMETARRHSRGYRYETTCGASLPVIETLKDLVRTGDRVLRIEGSLSGTLGYLTHEVMRGVALSAAVETARAKGYTEPNPQDDLSGLDVARKAVILARELGIPVELDDITVEPLVPEEILREKTLDGFFAALRRHDAAFTAMVDGMKREGRALRYLARIDPHAHSRQRVMHVGPVGVDALHPAARLRGSESFVAFTTERYSDTALIVQGAGAGGAVTAAGVLADVLRVAQALRGR